MRKLTLLCGPPQSGKTAVGIKIAEEMYYGLKKSVMYISADTVTPFMGLVFPNENEKKLFSLGEALEHTSITKENVLKHTVMLPKADNFGFLGYKAGENRYTYSRPTKDKITELFEVCKELAEHIFLDCSTSLDDPLTAYALGTADNAVRLVTPDIRSAAYYASFESEYDRIKEKCIGVINITDKDLYLPVGEVKNGFPGAKYILPYSMYLKQQYITGELTKQLPDAKFKAVCRGIAEAVK